MLKYLTPPIPVVCSFGLQRLKRCVTALALLGAGWAQADVIIESTRVIYNESRREVSFKVSNVSKDMPAFVQMWLDDGNAAATPEEAVTPFNLTPPIARLRADTGQVVRLAYTGEPLPQDRESLFYFNMLELPQKSNVENKLTFAVRTRIKVFFRPKAVRADPASVMNQVVWQVVQQNNQWVAEATNPTPFHMSFFSVSPGQNGNYEPGVDGGMVAPKGKFSVVLGEVGKIKPFSQIKVEYINDFGGNSPIEVPISARP